MSNEVKLPDDLTALNLKAFFMNEMGLCGCAEYDEFCQTLLALLQWHNESQLERVPCNMILPVGAFYLMAGWLDTLGLAEHGSSIRGAWLTAEGKKLLAAMETHSADDIEESSGLAYDGANYGDSGGSPVVSWPDKIGDSNE